MLKRLHKIVFFMLWATLVCLCAIGQARADKSPFPKLALSQSDQAWLAAHPVIRLGIDASYGPYSFIDEQGKLQGVVREFLDYLEPTLGVHFDIISDLDWPQLMAAVQARSIDAVATVVQLPERDAFLNFTSIYLPTPLVIVTHKDAPQLRSIQDLADLSLVLVEGYSSSKQIMAQYPDLQPHYVKTPLAGMTALASGAADAYVGVIGVNGFLASQNGIANLKTNAAFDMAMNGQRIGVRKDWPELVPILNRALASMPAQQKHAAFEKWLPLPADAIERLSQPNLITRLFPWLLVLTGLIVLGYLIVLMWNRQLKRELIRRQGELVASAERLRVAETIAHVGNWQYKVADGSIQWSDEVYRIFGVEPQSQPITYEWVISRIHPDDQADHDAYLQRMLESHPEQRLPEWHSRLVRPSGEVRFVCVLVRIEYDAAGKPHTMLGTLQDVSEQKKREEELKRLHSSLNALVEGSTDAIFVKDREGRYIVGNRVLTVLLGRPMVEILGANDYDLFPAEMAERFRADDQRIMAEGQTHAYEEVVTTPTASYNYLTTKGPLVIDGEVCGVFGIARDITDRKQTETALVESESRLRLFIEHAPAALAMFDREMRYLAASRRWLTDYKLESSDILSRSHYEVFPEITENWKAIHRRALAGEVVRADEDSFEREDGSVQCLRWEVRPWFGADSEVGGIVIFSEDITEWKQADDELRKQKNLLEHTGRLAHVGGWEIDVATMHGTLTDEMVRIHGLEPGPRITGADIMACLNDADKAQVERAQQAAIEESLPYELELEITTAKGERKWVHAVGLPVLEGGRVVRIEGAVQDITERKGAETRARQNWLMLDSVFQALPDLFFLMDADGTIRDYRAQQTSKLYAPPAVFLGKRMQDILPPELSAVFENKLGEVGKKGGLTTFEYELSMPEGTEHFEARMTQLPGSTQLIAVIRNITQQHQDHLALGQSESRYRLLFERSPAPMLVYERDSLRLLAVNEAFMHHYGYSHDEALALRLTDLYPEEEKQKITDFAASLTGLAFVGEWHHLTKQGNLITIEARSHDLPYEGHAARVAVITDITERKHTEQSLLKSEARYRSLLELAPFPAVISRIRDGTLVYGNHRAEVQYGISREQGIGQPAANFYEDATQRQRFLDPLQKTGKVDDLEIRMLTADGRPFWAQVSASIVEFDNEPAIFTAINDITARKQVEKSLQEQEVFFRQVAENIGDMVAVLDLNGRRLYNSPSYGALFGNPASLQGTDSFAEIHPDDRDKVREVFMKTVRTGHGYRTHYRFIVADGSERNIESQGGVILGETGQVERVVVVSRDISERKLMEDQILKLNAELEERVRQRTEELATANKELETFTYSVAHDLKAPLRGIDGYSHILLEDYQDKLDKTGSQLLNKVRNGVAQMSMLIEDLLAYSHMERRSLQGQSVDLSQLVDKILDTMQADIQQQGMVVASSLQGLTAMADPEGLAIVLRNLFDNALKFTRDSHPPTLSISGVRNEISITLIIKDNGIGFDMQFHNRIFEIFQRLQRIEDYPGTGVGLAIVLKAMQRMGGHAWAESEPGKGASFYLELPL
ncbi:MAG: PAS domain S-box protein [Thiobacillus sp.]